MKKKDLSNVTEVKKEGILNFKSIFVSLLLSYFVALVLFLILALVVTYTSFKEEHIKLCVRIIASFTIILSALFVSRRAKTSGWLNGGIQGIIYNLILFMLSFFIFDELNFDFSLVLSFAFSFLLGAIGGILGINMKK
ncbi:MAG: TIGR04086 family membrane protein [Ruminococcaceae bacterium]|nr:TIGR04086 family membrane protein [Oscillospiraceae bacterium]